MKPGSDCFYSQRPSSLRGLVIIEAASRNEAEWELFPFPSVFLTDEDVMKAYLTNLPMKIWLVLVVPTVVIAYPVIRIVVPAVVHAVVPEAVRTVLSVI